MVYDENRPGDVLGVRFDEGFFVLARRYSGLCGFLRVDVGEQSNDEATFSSYRRVGD